MKTLPSARRVIGHRNGRYAVHETGVVAFEGDTTLPWGPPSTARSGG